MLVYQPVKVIHKAVIYTEKGTERKRPNPAPKYEFIRYGQLHVGGLARHCRWKFVEGGDSIQELINRNANSVNQSQRWRVIRTSDNFVEDQG